MNAEPRFTRLVISPPDEALDARYRTEVIYEALPVPEVIREVGPDEVEEITIGPLEDEHGAIAGEVQDFTHNLCYLCLNMDVTAERNLCAGCGELLQELGFVRAEGTSVSTNGWLPVNESFDTALGVARRALVQLDRMRALVIGMEIDVDRPVIRLAREAPAEIQGERTCVPAANSTKVCSVPFAGCLLEWRQF